ncbi:MAG: hypothetical protein IIC23_13490 [Chloroflexi bacterium]|nr:hypothetical protein [Chloroflexota bacterium]
MRFYTKKAAHSTVGYMLGVAEADLNWTPFPQAVKRRLPISKKVQINSFDGDGAGE